MKNRSIKIFYMILPVLSLGLLIFAWIWAANNKPELFPTPADTWARFIKLIEKPLGRTPLWKHILDSLRRVGIAVLAACFLGIVFGMLMGWFKLFRTTIGSIFEMIRPIAPIAWIPLVTIWFGIGEFPKILIVFIGTFSLVVVNTYTGVAMVDPLNISVGRVFHATRLQTLMEIVLPASLPAIFAGVRMAVGTGWAIVLAAEMIGAVSGVGFLIFRGNETGDMALIFVSMFIIGIIGALLSMVTTWIERRLCPWRE